MKLQIRHSTNTDKFIREHHYLHTTPAGVGIGVGAFYAAAWVTVGVLLGTA